MTLEERVSIIEKNVDALIKRTDKNALYMASDITSTRQSVANITPTTFTKTAYIQDTEVVFTNVPQGNLTVSCDVDYAFSHIDDVVTVTFVMPLEKIIEVTISIL